MKKGLPRLGGSGSLEFSVETRRCIRAESWRSCRNYWDSLIVYSLLYPHAVCALPGGKNVPPLNSLVLSDETQRHLETMTRSRGLIIARPSNS